MISPLDAPCADYLIRRIRHLRQLRQSRYARFFRPAVHLRLIEEERDLQANLRRLMP
jgi:hypothetical protein